jgi:hypothetical protein
MLFELSPPQVGAHGPFVQTVNLSSSILYEVELQAETSANSTSPAGYDDVQLTISTQSQLNISPPPLQNNGKSLGTCSCLQRVGNPIDVGSGNKFESVVDYHTAGPNQLPFGRYYNSMASSGPFAIALGDNWRSTYDRYLYTPPSFVIAEGVALIGPTTTVSAQRANGQVLSFAGSGGNWVPDTDVDVQLIQTGATTWTLPE